MLANRVALRHRLDHGPPEVLGVRAREADPLDPLDRIAGTEELAELGPDLRQQVPSPGVDVLPEQRDLANAVGREAGRLGDDLAGPPAHLAPADRGDDAVRALRVAAHRDLHPGLEPALAVHRQLARERAFVRDAEPAARNAEPARTEPLAQMRDRTRPEGDVDLGIELEQALALGFRV